MSIFMQLDIFGYCKVKKKKKVLFKSCWEKYLSCINIFIYENIVKTILFIFTKQYMTLETSPLLSEKMN